MTVLAHSQSTSSNLPERYPSSGITILVAGAGVAGLVAALEGWRKGHTVRVIEKSPSRLTSGDGFTIGYPAIRILQKWPEMAVENDQIATEPWLSWHKITGEAISEPAPLQFNSPANSCKDGSKKAPRIWRHSRPKFHKMLTEQAERVGIFVEYGRRVHEYYEDLDNKRAGVILEDGQKLEADVVIAADGVGSKSSRAILGHEVPARPSGFSIYRAAFPLETAFADPVIKARFPLGVKGQPLVELWMGDNVHSSFARNQDEFSWSLTYPSRGESQESWSHLVDPSDVLETTSTIGGWPEEANHVIRATPKSYLHDFKMMWREPQPFWVSPGGHIVQVGDSAHTFLPSSGNGATQGIEDAISLTTVLQIAGRDQVSWATKVHNKLRFERVACLQKLGVINHQLRHRSANAQAEQARPFGLLAAWIWEHDPERYAIESYDGALAHVVHGATFNNTNIPPGHVYRPWTIDQLLQAKENGEDIILDGDWE